MTVAVEAPESALAAAVSAVAQWPAPAGLGSVDLLTGQVAALGSAVARLQRELAVRMAALEREGPPPTDVRGAAAEQGVPAAQAGALRRLGLFAQEHPVLAEAWQEGAATTDQVAALRDGCVRLPTPELRGQLVAAVLPHLPALGLRETRRAVAATVDALAPGDPDQDELSDHAARQLAWSAVAGGGIVFQGYLPQPEADAFMRAIDALAEDLRVADDGLSPGQRRADALSALVARAVAHGLPAGGGLPAALTLTVPLGEAQRVASRDPVGHGVDRKRRPYGGSIVGGRPAGDATVRFGLCCAAVTPALVQQDPTGFLGRIASTPAEPLAVGRSLRLATSAQRRALRVRDGGCVIPGCQVAAPYTQPHHVVPWAMDGPTDLENLVSLCWVHHRQTELGRWRFTRRRAGEARPDGALVHPSWWIVPPGR
jgi:hypothetical protein